MARFVNKSRHQKDMFHNEIGLCAQKIVTILKNQHKWEGLCCHVQRKRIVTLHLNSYCET